MKDKQNAITICEDNLERLCCFNSDMTIKRSEIDYLEFNSGHLLINNNSHIGTFHTIKPIEEIDWCTVGEEDVVIGRCKITNLLLNGYRVWIERGADIEYMLVSSTQRTRVSKNDVSTTGYAVIDYAPNIRIDTIKSLRNSKVEICGGNINNVFACGEILLGDSAKINSIELLDNDACVFVPQYYGWPKVKPLVKSIIGQKGKIHINGDVIIESIDISSSVKVAIASHITAVINKLIIDGKQIKDIKKYIKDHSVFYIYGPTDKDVEKL